MGAERNPLDWSEAGETSDITAGGLSCGASKDASESIEMECLKDNAPDSIVFKSQIQSININIVNPESTQLPAMYSFTEGNGSF